MQHYVIKALFISNILLHITAIYMYYQTSKISFTLVGNKIVDHSDVVGASPVSTAPTTSSFSPGFSGLGKDNCKMRQETFQIWGFGAT